MKTTALPIQKGLMDSERKQGKKVGFSDGNQRIKNTAQRSGMQIIIKICWKFKWMQERIKKNILKPGENAQTLKVIAV